MKIQIRLLGKISNTVWRIFSTKGVAPSADIFLPNKLADLDRIFFIDHTVYLFWAGAKLLISRWILFLFKAKYFALLVVIVTYISFCCLFVIYEEVFFSFFLQNPNHYAPGGMEF